MNGFMVGIENYILLERGKRHLSKNVWFSIGTISPPIWLKLGIPLFSQYVITLFPNTEFITGGVDSVLCVFIYAMKFYLLCKPWVNFPMFFATAGSVESSLAMAC